MRVGCGKNLFQSVKVVGAHMAANLSIDNGPRSSVLVHGAWRQKRPRIKTNPVRRPDYTRHIHIQAALILAIRFIRTRYRIRSIFENRKR